MRILKRDAPLSQQFVKGEVDGHSTELEDSLVLVFDVVEKHSFVLLDLCDDGCVDLFPGLICIFLNAFAGCNNFANAHLRFTHVFFQK